MYTISKCVPASPSQLLPAHMPPEIRKIIRRDKSSELYNFIKLIIKSISPKIQTKDEYFTGYYLMMYFKTKNLHNILHSVHPVVVYPRRGRTRRDSHIDYFGKSFILILNPDQTNY